MFTDIHAFIKIALFNSFVSLGYTNWTASIFLMVLCERKNYLCPAAVDISNLTSYGNFSQLASKSLIDNFGLFIA